MFLGMAGKLLSTRSTRLSVLELVKGTSGIQGRAEIWNI